MKIIASSKNTIGQADKMIYGHFIEHFHRQVYGGLFEPGSPLSDEDGFRTDVLDALRRIKTPIIRWPGGCYVSAYDWKYGVGKDRKPTYDKAWRVEEPNTFGTDEYIKLCRKIGCEPYICTNAGTGTAEQMSDWVEYCNLENEGQYARARIENGNTEPFNVKYWSIGNENWGGHEMGAKDRGEWGLLAREAAKMMLRVDPTIELSAASIPDLDWNLNLLREAGRYLNWISIHGYWDFTGDGIHHSGYEDVIMRTGYDIENGIDRVRAYLTAFGLEHRIKIAYDEWNLRGWYHPNIMDNPHRKEPFTKEEYLLPRDKNDRNETYTMADAVFSASFLNTCLRNCDIVGMACFSPVVNTRGCIFTYADGIVLRPTFYVFEMYANLMKDIVLDGWRRDVPTITKNNGRHERTVDAVDAVITYGDGEYAVAAVNKCVDSEQTLELSILDDKVNLMRIHTLNGESCDSYNDIGKNDVGVTVSEWVPYTGSITLPPHSVSVIEIK